MGHEFAGTIAQLGPGVEGWRPGQRVVALNLIGCGDCRFCRSENEQCCQRRQVIGVNTGTNGAFAEFVRVPARNLAALADTVSFSTALLNEPLAVSYHALSHLPVDAQTLVIVGGGTIGQCLVQVSKVVGGRQLFVLEPIEQKRRLAERHGATVLPPDPDLLNRHLAEGADAAIEAVGSEDAVRLAVETIRPGGTLVLLGNLAKEATLPIQHIGTSEKRLVGTYGFNGREFRTVIGWLNAGRFDLDAMITGKCGLDDAPQVFADLAAGRRQAVKFVVEP